MTSLGMAPRCGCTRFGDNLPNSRLGVDKPAFVRCLSPKLCTATGQRQGVHTSCHGGVNLETAVGRVRGLAFQAAGRVAGPLVGGDPLRRRTGQISPYRSTKPWCQGTGAHGGCMWAFTKIHSTRCPAAGLTPELFFTSTAVLPAKRGHLCSLNALS